MFYLVYKTTNLVNGKFYIGSHQTTRINDGYLGSGKILKKALKKYGRQNFKREVIASCVSTKASREVEGHFVRYAILKYKRMCYNRSFNGTGAMLGKENSFYGKEHSDETKRIIAEKASERYKGKGNPFFGRKHTKETILKIKNKRPNYDSCEKMRVHNYKKSLHWYCTPVGCFCSDRVASEVTGIGRNSIRAWCLNPDKEVKPNYQIPEKYWGRTWRENGFYFLEKTS